VTDLSHDAADDGFHEIQLSGKQLVFLFMATTVVSVVIFLCGVLVGRGVRGDTVRAAAATPPASSGAGPTPTKVEEPPPAPADGAAAGPLTYQKRLDSATPVQERLKAPEPAATATASKPVVEPAPAATDVAPAPKPAVPPPTVASPPPAPTVASPPPAAAKAGVWAVQVVALTDRAAASAVVARLKAKGYPVFLVSPQSGAPVQNYKVQVGKFEDRAEAEQVAGRLKKEEQFQPWILR
jgi:cell division septation protein DedD